MNAQPAVLLDEVEEAVGEALSASHGVAKLNTAHNGMMDYILQNPGASLRELSAHFGYTVPWCCRVINSDIFQSRLAERRKDIEGLIAHDIPAQLKAAAGLAIERITEEIGKSQDPEFLLDAFDKVMHRAGYAPKVGTPPVGQAVQQQQNNYFFLSKEDLARMRPNMNPPTATPEQVGHGTSSSLPAPAPEDAVYIEEPKPSSPAADAPMPST